MTPDGIAAERTRHSEIIHHRGHGLSTSGPGTSLHETAENTAIDHDNNKSG
jgi:hypothetical protein